MKGNAYFVAHRLPEQVHGQDHRDLKLMNTAYQPNSNSVSIPSASSQIKGDFVRKSLIGLIHASVARAASSGFDTER